MDWTLRELTSLVGMIAFGLLLMRLIGDRDHLDLLGHLIMWALLATILIGAVASMELQARVDPSELPNTVSLKLILAHRVVCIGIALMWPRLLGRYLKKRYLPRRRQSRGRLGRPQFSSD